MTQDKKTIKNLIIKPKSLYYKFASSMLGYIALLVNSILILYLALQRGNPAILMVFYSITIALNISQIIAIVTKFVLNQLGNFSRKHDIINLYISIAWLSVILIEFIVGTIVFGAFRIDLLLIFIFQSFAICIIIYYNEFMDYRINKKVRVYKVRETTKTVFYLSSVILVVVIQFFALLLPKLPPNIDDIFSPHRVLSYAYDEDDKGYYVTGVYSGLNNSIKIPLTYNGKPVIGIETGAIEDDGLISSIQIGEYDDHGMLVSNIQRLEKYSISLNLIDKIELPNSIVSMDSHAIKGQKIKDLIYYSANSFSLSNFDAPNLSNIQLKNTTSPVRVDYQNRTNIKVTVPKDLYNVYRENYYEYRNLFDVTDEDIIVIDFETGTDYFLDSLFFDVQNGGALLDISALKRIDDLTSPLVLDTELYNADPYANDGFVAKSGHVFRGWYRSPDWSMEITFNENHFGPIYSDTTIYAKWNPIKTIQLDWSNYDPYNGEQTFIQYVDTNDRFESIKLPQLQVDGGDISRDGYWDLIWKLNDNIIEETSQLYNLNPNNETLNIKAQWILKTPTLQYSSRVNNDIIEGSNLTLVFDETQQIMYKAAFSHEGVGVNIDYKWRKLTDSGSVILAQGTTDNNDIFNYLLRNVADSGDYILEITANAPTGETASISKNYKITIEKKNLDISSFQVPVSTTYIYNGNQQQLPYTFALPNDITVETKYEVVDNDYSYNGPVHVSEVPYNVEYTFSKNNQEQDNYHVAQAYSSILINPKTLTPNWNQTNPKWDNFTVTYDGQYDILRPSVIGLVGTDNASFVLSNTPVKNVGNYTSYIVGVDNPDYTVELENIENYKQWSILPKNIISTWDKKTDNYDASMKNFKLMLDGLVEGDVSSINANHFSYNNSINDVWFDKASKSLIFSVKDAGTYDVLVSSFNNANYSFTSNQTVLNVEKAQLSVSWNHTEITYSGDPQAARMTITGFANNDSHNYDDSTISSLLNISTNVSDIQVIPSETDNMLYVDFLAVNADTYNISILDVIGDNYTFSMINQTFTINRKLLTVEYTVPDIEYNGNLQYAKAQIIGMHSKDISNLVLSDFESTYSTSSYELYINPQNQVELRFGAEDANTYTFDFILSANSNLDSNYIINKVIQTFTISPRLIELLWDNQTYVYNGDTQSVEATINNLVNGDIIHLSYLDNQAIDKGVYIAKVSIDNPNYRTDASNDYQWQITEKTVTVTVSSSSYTYNGQYQLFDILYTGIINEDIDALIMSDFSYAMNIPGEISYDSLLKEDQAVSARFKAINANEYTINLLSTAAILSNYKINETISSFSITPKVVEYEWNYTTPSTYDKQSKIVNVAFTNLEVREDTGVLDVISVTYTNNVKANAGSYTAKVETINNNNYRLHETINRTLNWTIEPMVLSIEWNNSSLTFNGSHQQNMATAINLLAGDSISFTYQFNVMNTNDTLTQTINKGSYTASITGLAGISATNYKLPQENISKDYEITPLTLSATVSKTDYTYNGYASVGATLLISGFPNIQESSKFTASDFNYVLNADAISKTNQSISSVAFSIYSKNAGFYNFMLVDSSNSNYLINQIEVEYTVHQRQITISWPTTSHVYDGTLKSFAPTVANKISTDVINLTYDFEGSSYLGVDITSTSMKDAGEYVVRIVGISNSNYTISGLSNNVNDGILAKQFIIQKRAINLSVTNYDRVYNGNYQGANISLLNILVSDYSLFTNNPLVFSHSGDKIVYSNRNLSLTSVNAGTYYVEFTGLASTFANSNYYLSETSKVNINYKITPATISLVWSPSITTYNGSSQSITASIATGSVFTNVLTSTNDLQSLTLVHSNNTATNAGSYTASITEITGDAASNYKLPISTSKTWTIQKRTLSVEWSAIGTYTYDGTDKTVFLTVSNFVESDITVLSILDFTNASGSMGISSIDKDVTAVKLNFSQKNASTYTYRLLAVSNPNYTIYMSQVTWVINQSTVNLSWTASGTYTYNGYYQTVKLNINGFIESDISILESADFIGSTASMPISYIEKTDTAIALNFKQINAGTYTYQLSSIDNPNYKFVSTVNTWVISQLVADISWSSVLDFTYTGSQQSINAVVNNEVFREDTQSVDTVNLTLMNNAKTSAGTYTAYISAISNPNYKLQTSNTKNMDDIESESIYRVDW